MAAPDGVAPDSAATDPAPTGDGIGRLRLVLLAAIGTLLALQARDVFDRWQLELLVVPPIVTVTSLLGMGRRRLARTALALLGVAAATAVTTALAAGSVSDFTAAFIEGPRRILTTEWPSPSQPDLIATVGAGLAIALAMAGELAGHRRLHLSPLMPVLLAHGALVSLSAPGGPRLWWLLPLAAVSVVFVAARPGAGLRDRWTSVVGERRSITIALVALAVGAVSAVPIAFSDRADPRRNEDASSALTLLDPIEATLALQAIEEPTPLYLIELDPAAGGVDPDPIPMRWRTAALADYDGRRWAPELSLRPIGRRLGPDGERDIGGTVEFLDDDLQLVPLPGSPVVVDTTIETDPGRTLVRLGERPTEGTTVSFRSAVAPTAGDVDPGALASRETDENVSGLRELTETLIEENAPDGNVPPDALGRLRVLESAMRDQFLLDSDARGGGLQRALIVRFVRDTRRGNAEQFSTAFVLLARSIGVDARVATGFEAGADGASPFDEDGRLVLRAADARIWPEINTGDGWLAFDPVPDTEVSDAEPEPEESEVQTPAAPQPPVEPPPDATDDQAIEDVEDDTSDEDALPVVVEVGLRAAAVVGALLVPLLLAMLAVLVLKWRWRRKRLRGAPGDRIRGAWTVATSRLIDAGLTIAPSATNDEIADDGIELAPAADRELHRLATLSSAATFGEPARPDLLAEDAGVCLRHLETTMSDDRSRFARLRWRLSLRSLRRRTRTPV